MKQPLDDWYICIYQRNIWGHEWKECKNEASFSLTILMRTCIHIVGILDSSNTLQTSQLSMSYCTDVSAILQYLTPITAYHILENQRNLNVQLQSITSPEAASIPNISSTSSLCTANFKGSIHLWIATSHQFLWQHGL